MTAPIKNERRTNRRCILGNSLSNIEAEDIYWMRQALRNAYDGNAVAGGSPIGCVIARDGAIIGEGYNEIELRCDPTAHAEIVAMRRAGEYLRSSEFRGEA